MARILVSVARGESERKGARHRAANRQRAEQGLPRTNQHRSFGYAQDGVTVIEPEAKLIRDAYTKVLAGGSLHRLSQDWQATNTPTMQGGKTWGAQVIRQILLNPRNAGLATYRDDIVRQGLLAAIIDEGTWDATQLLLTDPGPHARRSTPPSAPGCCPGWSSAGSAERTVKAASRDNRQGQDLPLPEQASFDPARRSRWSSTSPPARPRTYSTDPMLAGLLDDDDAPDIARVRREVVGKRKRLETLAVEYANGNIGKPAMLAGTRALKTVHRATREADGSGTPT